MRSGEDFDPNFGIMYALIGVAASLMILLMASCGCESKPCVRSQELLLNDEGCAPSWSESSLPLHLGMDNVDPHVVAGVVRSIEEELSWPELFVITPGRAATTIPIVYASLGGGYLLGQANTIVGGRDYMSDSYIEMWEGMKGAPDEWIILKHEVYHLLGLAHSADLTSIMYPEGAHANHTSPSQSEIRALKLLYGRE